MSGYAWERRRGRLLVLVGLMVLFLGLGTGLWLRLHGRPPGLGPAKLRVAGPRRHTRETFRHQFGRLQDAARAGDREGSFMAALMELRWWVTTVEMQAELREDVPELTPERLVQAYDRAAQRAEGAADLEKLRSLQERYDRALRLLAER